MKIKWVNRICGKIGFFCYFVCLYYIWHLCQYGGIIRHLPYLTCIGAAFIISFTIWLLTRIYMKRKDPALKIRRTFFWLEAVVVL